MKVSQQKSGKEYNMFTIDRSHQSVWSQVMIVLILLLSAESSLGQNRPYSVGGSQNGTHGSCGCSKEVFSEEVSNSWNMLSLPFTFPDSRKSVVFPTATSEAFIYEGSYIAKETLKNSVGFWLKFGSQQFIYLNGGTVDRETIDVRPGWNMFGSISSAVPTGAVTTIGTSIASAFFGYNGGYLMASSIDPGRAFWVKVTTQGKLVLASGPAQPEKPTALDLLDKIHRFTFTDAAGNSQTLYLGASDRVGKSSFEMPPLAPDGVLDIRFASNTMVESFTSGNDASQEYQIEIRGAHFPLKVKWQLQEAARERIILTDADGGKAVGSVELNQEGFLVIDDESISALRLRIQEGRQRPTEYLLYQSYPNPFNPVAKIRFDLIDPSIVSLKIFNTIGQEMAVVLQNAGMDYGTHEITFDASTLPSGTYFYRIEARDRKPGRSSVVFTQVRKMVLVR